MALSDGYTDIRVDFDEEPDVIRDFDGLKFIWNFFAFFFNSSFS